MAGTPVAKANSALAPSYEQLSRARLVQSQRPGEPPVEMMIGEIAIESSNAVPAGKFWRWDLIWLALPIMVALTMAIFVLSIYGTAAYSEWLTWIVALMVAYFVVFCYFLFATWFTHVTLLEPAVWLALALCIVQSIVFILWLTVYDFVRSQSAWFWWTLFALHLSLLVDLANTLAAFVNQTSQAMISGGHVNASLYNYEHAKSVARDAATTGMRIGLGYVEMAHMANELSDLRQRQLHIGSPMAAAMARSAAIGAMRR